MTLPVPISLKCPCCKTKFEGLDVMISSTFGSSTDLRQISGGSDPMYMSVHTCPSCGYTGYDDAFKRKRIDPTLKERISKEITPLMKDFSVNAITNQMKVTYDPSIVSIPDIETAVKKAGVTAIPVKSK